MTTAGPPVGRLPLAIVLGALLAVALAFPSPAPAAAELRVGAWVPYWDQDQASAVLRSNRKVVDSSSPFWFEARGARTIRPYPGAGDPLVLKRLRKAGEPVVPTVTSSMKPKKAVKALGRERSRSRHVRRLIKLARPYDGLDFNYEHPALTTSRDRARKVRAALNRFFRDACAALGRREKLCVVTVMPRTSTRTRVWRDKLIPWVYDYRRIGEAADRVRVMAYDQHAPGTRPGAIAGAPWVRRVARFAASEIEPRRLELGIPLYGRDWLRGSRSAEAVTWVEAERRRRTAGVKRRYSKRRQAPRYRYGNRVVHYSDGRSVAARGRIAKRIGFRGVYLWAPGGEDPRTWRKLGKLR